MDGAGEVSNVTKMTVTIDKEELSECVTEFARHNEGSFRSRKNHHGGIAPFGKGNARIGSRFSPHPARSDCIARLVWILTQSFRVPVCIEPN